MFAPSKVLAELIEPTLFAIREAPRAGIAGVLQDARKLSREIRLQLRTAGDVFHELSYEMGVATAFVELLSTSEQRSTLKDVLRELDRISDGLSILHEVALVSRSGRSDTKQRDFAQHLGVDPGNFSRRARKLVELGLLETKRVGKGLTYELTLMGNEVLDELRPGWKARHPIEDKTFTSEADASEAADVLLRKRLDEPASMLSLQDMTARLASSAQQIARESRGGSLLGQILFEPLFSGEPLIEIGHDPEIERFRVRREFQVLTR